MNNVDLTLFFTKGVSLETWADGGMLTREVALYRALAERGHKVRFVSYGGDSDQQYADQIPSIELLTNRLSLPLSLYSQSLRFRLPKSSRQIFKSNQMNGAEIGLSLARRRGAKFIARAGYLHSLNTAREHGFESQKAQDARELEQKVYTAADQIFVTTQSMRNTLLESYDLNEERVAVVPNYVESQRFSPSSTIKVNSKKVIYVGRLSREKNVDLLIRAMQGLDASLEIVGAGADRSQLKNLARELDVQVDFVGSLANLDLPTRLNSAALFVLPSEYEGHPKSLIEAMACGRMVLGSKVSGIREIISHDENGWLCEAEPEAMHKAIKLALAKPALQKRLGKAAREFALEHFSLERVLELELAHYEKLLEQDA